MSDDFSLWDRMRSLSASSCDSFESKNAEKLRHLVDDIENGSQLSPQHNWMVAALETGNVSLVRAVLEKDISHPPVSTLSFSTLALWGKIFVTSFLFEEEGKNIGVDITDVLFSFGCRCTPEDIQKDIREIDRLFGIDNPPVHFVNPLASLVVFGFKKMQKDWDNELWEKQIRPLAELFFYSGCDPRPAFEYVNKNNISGSVRETLENWSVHWNKNEIGFAVDETGDIFHQQKSSRRM